ncbi:guanylate kinase [Lentinula edodes]|uniref:Guanylate kinase n=1 Tax=Lentinula edodes TaxID=5353 RepID=A0A1Q3ED99_LENED|nr:guanylate kinase [Lentinula edodes]
MNGLSLGETRSSLDSERSNPASPIHVNGNGSAQAEPDESPDSIERLQRELQRTREEKEALATQYRNLLAKLTQMRTTLGNKLKQDAEELDRREQLVQQLTAQNDDLNSTLETLKEELISASEESARTAAELDNMRNRAFQETTHESLLRERELRETQTELEQCRLERDEWERVALQERAFSEDARSAAESITRDLELEKERRARELAELALQRERGDNLQSVLQDFQAAKEHELRQAVKDYESQLIQTSLEESQTNNSRAQELEKEVKEKTVLVNKLRHEAVIINEHLMEALRRLRKNSSDTNVDRRLVTNVLLSFLTTPRADAKRFEMLSLLSSILSWSDIEREKAGLQRSHQPSVISPSSSFWRRTSTSDGPGKSADLQKTDETESFSRLWVEFLLTEAAAGESHSAATIQLPLALHLMAHNGGYPLLVLLQWRAHQIYP